MCLHQYKWMKTFFNVLPSSSMTSPPPTKASSKYRHTSPLAAPACRKFILSWYMSEQSNKPFDDLGLGHRHVSPWAVDACQKIIKSIVCNFAFQHEQPEVTLHQHTDPLSYEATCWKVNSSASSLFLPPRSPHITHFLRHLWNTDTHFKNRLTLKYTQFPSTDTQFSIGF